MRYFVIADDGQKYGPADVPTLSAWAAEGRLLPGTMLEGEVDGQTLPARLVSGIVFPGGAQQGFAQGPTNTEGFSNYPRGAAVGNDYVPRKFNWGAFYFSWIWGCNHKKYFLLALIPVGLIGFIPAFGRISPLLSLASFGFQIWVGYMGNQWAWESGRFRTIDEMTACQVIWAKWALGFLLASIVGGMILGVLMVVAFSGMGR